MAPPETVLTELVIVTLLASVAKSHHTFTVAVGTLNWMEDWRKEVHKMDIRNTKYKYEPE